MMMMTQLYGVNETARDCFTLSSQTKGYTSDARIGGNSISELHNFIEGIRPGLEKREGAVWNVRSHVAHRHCVGSHKYLGNCELNDVIEAMILLRWLLVVKS